MRPILERAVRAAEYETGSKMLAYDRVAGSIGKSASWVRKLVGRHAVGLQHFEFLNIVRAYAVLCEGVEEVADRLEAAADAYGRRADAAEASAVPGLEGSLPDAARTAKDGRA